MGETLAFYTLAGALLLFSAGVVSLRNIFHCGLCLAGALVAVAGLYVLLYAEFLAAVQVLVYAGGVVALILFAVVLSQKITGRDLPQTNDQKWAGLAVAGLFFFAVSAVLMGVDWPVAQAGAVPHKTVSQIGRLLLKDYVIPFEVASVVLLVAVLGAIGFVKREVES